MKITGPFGDRDDGRVDRTRGEVRKDRTVDDMKPRHACDRRVGTGDGAGIRSHPAGSDRPAIRCLYSHAALLRSRRGNVPDGTVWASVLQPIVPSRHSCAFKRLKRSGCRFPRFPIRFHGDRDASPSFQLRPPASGGNPPDPAWIRRLRRVSRQANCGSEGLGMARPVTIHLLPRARHPRTNSLVNWDHPNWWHTDT